MKFIFVESKISLLYLYILGRLRKKNYAVQTLSPDLPPHPSEPVLFIQKPESLITIEIGHKLLVVM